MTSEAAPGMIGGVDLLDRIRSVLEENEWSEAEWSRRAGLKEKTHLSTLIRRLEQNPEGTLDLKTAAALADAAKVSLDWLALGRGTKGGSVIVAEADPLYPTRAVALTAAATFGYRAEAIEAVRRIHGLSDDPGIEYWLSLLRAENERATKLLPPGPSSRPRGKKRIPARKRG